ncbi:MAG: hypothetical protein OXR66_06155 [Candidatus Woesearchaeota archaeon]|nr:hypothetical protein [Candidatus Woesearchaeota archaeon]
MKRTLIKQGHSGYTIYLPKKWVELSNLSAGDKIDVQEFGRNLVVKTREERELTLDMRNIHHNFKNIIVQTFRTGTHKLTLQHVKEKHHKIIERVSNELLPNVVAEFSKDTCVLRAIVTHVSIKIDMLLRKLFFVITETRDITENFLHGKEKNLEGIRNMRKQADILITNCKSAIYSSETGKNRIFYWEFLTLLSFLHHEYQYLCEQTHGKASKPVLEMFAITDMYMNHLKKGFLERSQQHLDKIKKMKKSVLYGKCYEILDKGKKNDMRQLCHLREIIRLAHIAMNTVVAIVLNEKSNMR